MESTAKQRSAIAIMIRQLNLKDYLKEDLILSYTSDRTTSIKGLSSHEAATLISDLKKDLGLKDTPKERMQRKIISLAHEINWKLPSGRIDRERIDKWCIKHGYLKKPLRDYTEAQLPALVTQFEQVHLHHLHTI